MSAHPCEEYPPELSDHEEAVIRELLTREGTYGALWALADLVEEEDPRLANDLRKIAS